VYVSEIEGKEASERVEEEDREERDIYVKHTYICIRNI
jgi:hypothetical protein